MADLRPIRTEDDYDAACRKLSACGARSWVHQKGTGSTSSQR